MKKQTQAAWDNLQIEFTNQNMLLIDPPKPPQKKTLMNCLADSLSISQSDLHKKISEELKLRNSNQSLPRRLSYIYNDPTIIQDYQSDHVLANFVKITLEMVSLIYERKVIMYWLEKDSLLNSLIVNQAGYLDQTALRVARVANSFSRVQLIPTDDFLTIDNSSKKISSEQMREQQELYNVFRSQKNILTSYKDKIEAPSQLQVQSTVLIPGPTSKKSVTPQIQTNTVQNLSLTFEQEKQRQNPSKVTNKIDNTTFEQEQARQLIGQCNKISNGNAATQQIPNHQQLNVNRFSNNGNYQIPLPMNMDMGYNPMMQYYHQPMYYPQEEASLMRTQSNRSQKDIYSPSPPSHQNRSPNAKNAKQIFPGENERFSGKLKFFDEGKNYGFIIMDSDDSDIFVHYDDLQKAGIHKDRIKNYKQNEGTIRFSFKVMSYYGKYKNSRKAVQLILLESDFNRLLTPMS